MKSCEFSFLHKIKYKQGPYLTVSPSGPKKLTRKNKFITKDKLPMFLEKSAVLAPRTFMVKSEENIH